MSYNPTGQSVSGRLGVRPPGAVGPQGREGDAGPAPAGFRTVIGIFRRHIGLVVVLFVLTAVCGTVLTLFMYFVHPTYMARAVLVVDPGTPAERGVAVPAVDRNLPSTELERFIVTEISRIEDLAVLRDALAPELAASVNAPGERGLDGVAGERTGDAEQVQARTQRVQDRRRDFLGGGDMAVALQRIIRVYCPYRSNEIRIELTGEDPQLVADIVNSVADSYMLAYKGDRRAEERRRFRRLQTQREALAVDLRRASDELNNFKKVAGVVFLTQQRTDATDKFGLLDRAMTEADLAVIAAELMNEQMKILDDESSMGQAQVELEMDRDQTFVALRGAEIELRREKERLSQQLGPIHDEMRAVESRLANTQSQLEAYKAQLKATLIAQRKQEAQLRYDAALQNWRLVSARYEAAKKAATDLAEQALRYETKLEEYKDLRGRDAVLADFISQESTRAEVSANNVRVRQEARPPDKDDRYGPLLVLYLPASVVLALLVSLGMAGLVDVIDNRVRTPQQVIQQVRMAVLGTVPDRREDPRAAALGDLWTVALKAPQSLIAESFRQVRTALMYSTDAQLKTLLITSPEAGTGKTVVAANLAITLAGGGSRVLLVDTNFRRPMVHRALDLPNTVGLSSVLARLNPLEQAIQGTSVTNLDVLCCGPLPPSPADLLGSEGMQKLLADVAQRYDTVILDGAPVLIVSDAHVLCSMVDGVALVISSTDTSYGVAIRAKRALLGLRAKVVGAVLNRVRATRGGYFREAYRSYYDYAAKAPAELPSK